MLKFKNYTNGRYYYVRYIKDMLDDYILCISRGGRHNRCMSNQVFRSLEEVQQKLFQIKKRRLANGYDLIS